MSTTRVSRHIWAPREVVYRALLDVQAVAIWMVPDGMTSKVHKFDPQEGGSFRISLTYDQPTATGKTTALTDTHQGRFTQLVPNERVVVEFETDDPNLQGEMTIFYSLTDGGDGTHLSAVHEDLPEGVSAAENEKGWQSSLSKLAAYAGKLAQHS